MRLEFIDRGPGNTILIMSVSEPPWPSRTFGYLDSDSIEWFFMPDGDYPYGIRSRELLKLRQVIMRLNRAGGYRAVYTHKISPNGNLEERRDSNG